MDFDFYKQYQDYSIPQLLQLLREPYKYQDAAVEAAQRVLTERNPAEVEAARVQLYPIAEKLPEAEEHSIFDETEPGYDPRHVLAMRVLVVLIYAYYAVTLLYTTWPYLRFMLTEGYFEWTLALVIPAVMFLIYIALIVLLARRMAIGWIAAMVISIYDVLARIGLMWNQAMHDFGQASVGMSFHVTHLLIQSAVIFLLWTPALRDAYRISNTVMRRTILISTGLGLLPHLIRYIFS